VRLVQRTVSGRACALYCNALTADMDDAGLDQNGRLLPYNASVVGFIKLLECFALELRYSHLAEHLGIALACDGAFNNFAGHDLSQGLFSLGQPKDNTCGFKSPVHGFKCGGFEREISRGVLKRHPIDLKWFFRLYTSTLNGRRVSNFEFTSKFDAVVFRSSTDCNSFSRERLGAGRLQSQRFCSISNRVDAVLTTKPGVVADAAVHFLSHKSNLLAFDSKTTARNLS